MIDSYIFSDANKKLEVVKLDLLAENYSDCPICILPLNGDNKLVKTTCVYPHLFHAGCLKEWSKVSLNDRNISSCPTCRNDITQMAKVLIMVNDEIKDEGRISAAVRSLARGKEHLEKARQYGSESGWHNDAIPELLFAFENGISEAKPFLAEAKMMRGSEYLEKARQYGSESGWHNDVIPELLFAFENGISEAKPFLAEAKMMRGSEYLEKARQYGSESGWHNEAIPELLFAFENGIPEAKPLLDEANSWES